MVLLPAARRTTVECIRCFESSSTSRFKDDLEKRSESEDALVVAWKQVIELADLYNSVNKPGADNLREKAKINRHESMASGAGTTNKRLEVMAHQSYSDLGYFAKFCA